MPEGRGRRAEGVRVTRASSVGSRDQCGPHLALADCGTLLPTCSGQAAGGAQQCVPVPHSRLARQPAPASLHHLAPAPPAHLCTPAGPRPAGPLMCTSRPPPRWPTYQHQPAAPLQKPGISGRGHRRPRHPEVGIVGYQVLGCRGVQNPIDVEGKVHGGVPLLQPLWRAGVRVKVSAGCGRMEECRVGVLWWDWNGWVGTAACLPDGGSEGRGFGVGRECNVRGHLGGQMSRGLGQLRAAKGHGSRTVLSSAWDWLAIPRHVVAPADRERGRR